MSHCDKPEGDFIQIVSHDAGPIRYSVYQSRETDEMRLHIQDQLLDAAVTVDMYDLIRLFQALDKAQQKAKAEAATQTQQFGRS
jgi:hypothetical protein